MTELLWEEVKEKLQALLERVDPESTTTKDIFRFLTEELGQGVKTFKTEIRECIATFFEERSSEEETFSIQLSPAVALSVVEVSGKKRVEIRHEVIICIDGEGEHLDADGKDGKTVMLSGWDFCTLASKLEIFKGAIAGERDGFHIDLGPNRTAMIVQFKQEYSPSADLQIFPLNDREELNIELQQHNGGDIASRSIETVVRMNTDALDVLKENKEGILQALHVLQAEETNESGTKRPLETKDSPPGKSQKAQKSDEPPAKARKMQKDDDVYVLELTDNIRLTVSEFKGRMRTDIRRYYTVQSTRSLPILFLFLQEKTSGELRPTPKGLSMDKEQLGAFVECFDDLKAAVKDHKTDYHVEIGHNRRVSVSDFTGRCMVDLREYFQDKSGGPPKPGKKGICFDVGLLDVIASHINDIMTTMK